MQALVQVVRISKHYQLPIAILALLCAAPPVAADHVLDPLNPAPVPRAVCGPGSNPESDLQGRVLREEIDNGRAAEGYTCNTEILGRFGLENYQGAAGGFKTFRYVDSNQHECGYYDSTLLFPANVTAGELPGVYVMDMSDPTNPTRVTTLVTPAMLSPHESLVLHQERGLLVAVNGNPTSGPGVIDIYDVSDDCLNPILLSSTPTGYLGHESGITPDGNTYYVASLDTAALTAVDISNPLAPVPIFLTLPDNREYRPHGLNTSDDGNRLYIAEREGLVILDVSQVQARVLNPQITEISSLDWEPIRSTPQVAIPVTIRGNPYLIEIDEFSDGDDNAGAARIIDIADEQNPVIVSDIRLEVHSTENRVALLGDYGSGPSDTLGFMGYNGHYCTVPQRNEPGVVACTFILSGMRLFDIRDPFHPKEIAYFNGPILPNNAAPGFDPAPYAMSAPVLVPERNELWYADANSGFYAVRVTNGAWPRPEPEPEDAGTKTTGGGWLASDEGEKINFGFNTKQKDSGPQGQLQLNDKTAGVKIHLSDVTAIGAVGDDCGSVVEGPNALEFQGTGTFNGPLGNGAAEFVVCVEDNGEPGNSKNTGTPDRFYLACLSGCDYDTASRTPDDAIDGGNIQLHRDAAGSQGAGASVLILDPVNLSEASAGVQLLSVTAYGSDGETVPGASVSLERLDVSGVELVGITDPGGTATFQVNVLTGAAEWIARSGDLDSNVVALDGLPTP